MSHQEDPCPDRRADARRAAGPKPPDLRIGLAEDPDVLDPDQSRTFVGRIVYASLCDKLVDITPDLEIIPQLATGWNWSEDGKTLTMNLREGVTFHDGEPFNAEAVAANIDRSQNLDESRRKSEVDVDRLDRGGRRLHDPDQPGQPRRHADRAVRRPRRHDAVAQGRRRGAVPISAMPRSAPGRSSSTSACSRTGSCWRNSRTTGTPTRSTLTA